MLTIRPQIQKELPVKKRRAFLTSRYLNSFHSLIFRQCKQKVLFGFDLTKLEERIFTVAQGVCLYNDKLVTFNSFHWYLRVQNGYLVVLSTAPADRKISIVEVDDDMLSTLQAKQISLIKLYRIENFQPIKLEENWCQPIQTTWFVEGRLSGRFSSQQIELPVHTGDKVPYQEIFVNGLYLRNEVDFQYQTYPKQVKLNRQLTKDFVTVNVHEANIDRERVLLNCPVDVPQQHEIYIQPFTRLEYNTTLQPVNNLQDYQFGKRTGGDANYHDIYANGLKLATNHDYTYQKSFYKVHFVKPFSGYLHSVVYNSSN